MPLIPKNWTTFQHYKDRNPAWIKLHRGLLDNRDFYCLSDAAGKTLPLLWLLASERDGILPGDDEIAFRLRVEGEKVRQILAELVERGFLVAADTATQRQAEQGATLAQQRAAANGFGNRHISDAVKRFAWARDGGKCRLCGSEENIEYDHVVPVSKGGNSNEENIQLLCRPCNRKKRVRLSVQAEQLATDDQGSRSLEKEKQVKLEKEEDSRAVANATRTEVEKLFEEFWREYPKREGAQPKAPALKSFLRWIAPGRKYEINRDVGTAIVAGAKRYADELRSQGKIGTPYVAQAVTWLNQQRWKDYPEPTSTGPPQGWREGLPTDAELRAKYGKGSDDGEARIRLEQDSSVAPGGLGIREGQPRLARSESRKRGTQSLGKVLSDSGVVSADVSTSSDGQGGDLDGALPLAGMADDQH